MASEPEVVEAEAVEEVLPAEITAGMPQFDDLALRGITSFDDAVEAATAEWGEVVDYAEEFGSGFSVLENKTELVGERSLILSFKINEGKWGGFVSALVLTERGGKYIVNDGSEGMYKQLRGIALQGRNGGILMQKGLSRSTYDTCMECGKPRRPSEHTCTYCGDASERRSEGETFYIAA